MIGRYSDQSEARSGFSLPNKCFRSDVLYLGSVNLWAWSLQMNCIANSFQSSYLRIDLETGFYRQKIFRELFTCHKAVPVTFLITNALQHYARSVHTSLNTNICINSKISTVMFQMLYSIKMQMTISLVETIGLIKRNDLS